MSNLTDSQIIKLVKDGHPEAFNELVLRYQDRIFNSVYKYAGNYEDATDITQQTFINAYEHVSDFKEKSSLSTWLYRIAFNLSVSHFRSRSRQKHVSIDQRTDEDDRLSEPVLTDNPHTSSEREELKQKIQSALENLDDESRKIVILREFDNLSYNEIADALNTNVGTVRSKLHRARLFLKEKLASFIETFHEG